MRVIRRIAFWGLLLPCVLGSLAVVFISGTAGWTGLWLASGLRMFPRITPHQRDEPNQPDGLKSALS